MRFTIIGIKKVALASFDDPKYLAEYVTKAKAWDTYEIVITPETDDEHQARG
jgi:hypothetical protein